MHLLYYILYYISGFRCCVCHKFISFLSTRLSVCLSHSFVAKRYKNSAQIHW